MEDASRFAPDEDSPLSASEAIETELNRARQDALRGVLLGGASAATLAFVVGLIVTISSGGSLARFWVLGAAVLLAWGVALAQRLPIVLRVGLIVIIVFATGVEDVFSVGLVGQVRQNFLVVIILAAGLIGVRAGFIVFGLTVISLGLLSWLVNTGRVVPTATGLDPVMVSGSSLVIWLRYLASLAAVNYVVFVLLRSLRNVLARQRQLLVLLVQERREAEKRVAERGAALQVAAELSSNVALMQEREQLILTLVERIRATFNYYYLHIYLFDAARENLIVAGGTGETGRALFVGGHRMPLGQGLVGRAAAKSETILVPDVSQDPDWQPNMMLPDTKSELAIPIVVGGEVFGVLDVQQDRVDGLSSEDVNLLLAIANQIGIAVQNAELFRRAEAQAAQQSNLTELRRKIFLAPNYDQLTQIAARELATMARVEKSRVQLIQTNQTAEDAL